jgi:hypothetical protein
LEFQVGFFKVVWTMVSSQRKCLIEWHLCFFSTNNGQLTTDKYLVCLSQLWWRLFCWRIPTNCKKYVKKNLSQFISRRHRSSLHPPSMPSR